MLRLWLFETMFPIFFCVVNGILLFASRCSLHQSRITLASVQVDRKVLEEAFVRFGELKTATWAPMKYKMEFLIGGLEHFLFFHTLGIIISTDIN